MTNDTLIRELRLQSAILRAAFSSQLDTLSKSVRSDVVCATIIDHLGEVGPTRSGALKEAVVKKVPAGTDASDRTIKRRLADLENKGIIERVGQAANTEYSLTGLVE